MIGHSGCPEVASSIEEGVDGFLCADARLSAHRLSELLADAALCLRMDEAGRKKVFSKYTWSAVAVRVRAVYEGCIAERGERATIEPSKSLGRSNRAG